MVTGWLLRLVQGGLGDTIAATALARDLATAYPDAPITVSGSSAAAVFSHCPYAGGVDRTTDRGGIPIDYRATIDRASHGERSSLYMYAAHDAFEAATGLTVPRGVPLGEVHLGPDDTRPDPEPYWVMFAGSRWDMPVKAWPPGHFAEVVRLTPGIRWKQVGRLFDGRAAERQVAVEGAENLLGRTSVRALIRLVAHSAGVLTTLSCGLVLAGAFRRPCVVLVGGREAPWQHQPPFGVWPTLTVFHSIGRYDCCRNTGCSRRLAYPAHDGPHEPGWLCALPVADPSLGHVARCLYEIDPAGVAARVHALNH